MPQQFKNGNILILSALVALAALALRAEAPPAVGPVRDVNDLVVDPNTAPPEVLAALPRLGPALVGRIVEARAAAPFASLDDLDRRVSGIGPATIPILRPHLRIDPESPATPAPLNPPCPTSSW